MTDAPTCQAKDCDQEATNQIHGVMLDGTEYSVYTCGQHDEDPDPERITVGCEVEAFDLDPQHTTGKELLARGTVESIKTQAGRRCFEIRADDAPLRSQEGNLIPVWERADREIERVDAD